MKTTDPHEGDRRLLGWIAGGSLAIIAVVAVGVIAKQPTEAAIGLLGVIVGGLLVNGKDTIGAIKERWLGQQVQRMSDQMSLAPPVTDPGTPQRVQIDQTGAPPVPVTEEPSDGTN